MKRQNHKYYLAGLVALLTFIVYLTSLQNELVNWDDTEYITENPYIRTLDFTFLKWAFFLISTFNMAVKIDPDYSEAYSNRGYA